MVTAKMSPNLFVLHGSEGLDPAHPDASGGRVMVLFGPDGVLMVDTKTDRWPKDTEDDPVIHQRAHQGCGQHAYSWRPYRRQRLLRQAGGDDLLAGKSAQSRCCVRRPARTASRRRLPIWPRVPVVDLQLRPAAPAQPAVTFNMNGETVDFIPMMPSHTAGDTIVRFRKANVIYIEDFYRNFGYPVRRSGQRRVDPAACSTRSI